MKSKLLLCTLFLLFTITCTTTNAKKVTSVPKKTSEWSSYQGLMTWEEANQKCRSIGLFLPSVEEMEEADKSGITLLWKKDIIDYLKDKNIEPNENNSFATYWTSTVDPKNNRTIFYDYHIGYRAFLSHRNAVRQVRCYPSKGEQLPEETGYFKSYRGIHFYPFSEQKVNSMTIRIPSDAARYDSIQAQLKYPISFFKADCQQVNACFSLLIDVSVIPEKTTPYEKIIEESQKKDFSAPPGNVKVWVDNLKFKTPKTTILFGPGEIMGNKAIGFYYYKKNKETYRVTINLIYSPNFSEQDWKEIIAHVFMIFDSININS